MYVNKSPISKDDYALQYADNNANSVAYVAHKINLNNCYYIDEFCSVYVDIDAIQSRVHVIKCC